MTTYGYFGAVAFQSVERIRSSSGCVMADNYTRQGTTVGLDDNLWALGSSASPTASQGLRKDALSDQDELFLVPKPPPWTSPDAFQTGFMAGTVIQWLSALTSMAEVLLLVVAIVSAFSATIVRIGIWALGEHRLWASSVFIIRLPPPDICVHQSHRTCAQ